MGIGVGVFLFKTYEVNEAPVRDTELLGVCFISAYMVCDSFTSNYQSRVFKQYSVGSITMMVYTNLFSTAFTALGLCLTWELADVSRFVSENPAILPHIFLMAVCSAIGHQPAETRRESPRVAESSREPSASPPRTVETPGGDSPFILDGPPQVSSSSFTPSRRTARWSSQPSRRRASPPAGQRGGRPQTDAMAAGSQVRQLLSIFNSFVQFGHEVAPTELLLGIGFLNLLGTFSEPSW